MRRLRAHLFFKIRNFFFRFLTLSELLLGFFASVCKTYNFNSLIKIKLEVICIRHRLEGSIYFRISFQLIFSVLCIEL